MRFKVTINFFHNLTAHLSYITLKINEIWLNAKYTINNGYDFIEGLRTFVKLVVPWKMVLYLQWMPKI